jgi:glycosyltransferase involved in cell wall biosynthesis
MQKISIVIATYGTDYWKILADKRARPAAERQLADEIIVLHDPDATSPAKPRNDGVMLATGDMVVFCDADDELEDGYIDAMRRGSGDIRYPRVRYIPEKWREGLPIPQAAILPRRSLLLGNYIVIGAAFRRDQFLQVGGFDEWETYEDWALYLKLTYIGAQPMICPGAIYRVYRKTGSRVHQTKDPVGLTKKILENFKVWAYEFNGGDTSSKDYQTFLGKSPQGFGSVSVLVMDRKDN